MDWTADERRILRRLRTPAHIQAYLDELEYDARAGAASPRAVMRRGMANCFSGVLFACAALRELGHPPRMMYIEAATDDGHCLALYRSGDLWGALAKSNFTTLRSREPVHTYLSLGLSYFEGYYNQYGKRTMRSFTEPVDLEPFEARGWRFSRGSLPYIDHAIDTSPLAWKLPRRLVRELSAVSEQLRRAGLFGSKAEGLWKRSG
jgi:hypothetical protein